MKRPAFVSNIAIPVAISLLVAIHAMAASVLETVDREVSALYERNRDAVVRVFTQRQPVFPFGPGLRVGTGFFIDADGHFLTSATVVEAAEKCWIEWRGKKIPARIVGQDPLTSLAVLHVPPDQCVGTGEKLPFLKLGNSDDLKTGSMLISIGFPFDQPSAPTVGFVQGFDIKCGNRTFITSHIRSDCRLQPGQGGGPVCNTRGEVVGVAVAAHREDQSYVLPINAGKKVFTDIVQHGAPQYGWVGLSVTERRLNLLATEATHWEVFIEEVCSNTPASFAGFRTQDVLIRIESNNVHRAADILNVMFRKCSGDKVNITVVRSGGSTQQVQLVIGKRPAEETELATRQPTLPPPVPVPAPSSLPAVVPVSASVP
jgi:serine protease Do